MILVKRSPLIVQNRPKKDINRQNLLKYKSIFTGDEYLRPEVDSLLMDAGRPTRGFFAFSAVAFRDSMNDQTGINPDSFLNAITHFKVFWCE